MNIATPNPADQRSAEILGAVRRAFVEKGFDGASMQDLARAAGMSVGNFYRYFPSKSAIILALIGLDLAQIQRDFQQILNAPQPMQALRHGLRARIDGTICDNDHDLWTEIEAATRRSPEIAAAARQMESAVVAALMAVIAAETGLTQAETDRFTTQARFIVVLFKAASCMNCTDGSDQSELKSMIIRTIEQTLDDVTNSAKKA